MNRTEFQQLADIRIAEAEILLSQGKYDGAYYLGGYAAESALKACIAKLTNQGDFPNKKFAANCYTHNIERLVRLADLEVQRDADANADAHLLNNWAIVKDWSESSRYDRANQTTAQQLYDAITDSTHGVLPWIKRHR